MEAKRFERFTGKIGSDLGRKREVVCFINRSRSLVIAWPVPAEPCLGNQHGDNDWCDRAGPLALGKAVTLYKGT